MLVAIRTPYTSQSSYIVQFWEQTLMHSLSPSSGNDIFEKGKYKRTDVCLSNHLWGKYNRKLCLYIHNTSLHSVCWMLILCDILLRYTLRIGLACTRLARVRFVCGSLYSDIESIQCKPLVIEIVWYWNWEVSWTVVEL